MGDQNHEELRLSKYYCEPDYYLSPLQKPLTMTKFHKSAVKITHSCHEIMPQMISEPNQ